MNFSKASLLLLLGCASICLAGQAPLPMVAVLPFDAASLTPDARTGIANALGNELLHTGKFRVMERSQMDQILKEQAFQNSGACDDNGCAVEMGKLLAVDAMVLGSVAKVGSTYSLTARLVDVRTGEVRRSVGRNSKADVDALLTDAAPDAARELAGVKASSHWGWWVAGGVAVAGGATAAVLLLNSKSSSTPSAAPADPSPSTVYLQAKLP